MNKYRVLKPYPKQITNSGRLITLKKGASVYLKKEAQVLRLIKLGYIKPVVALPKRAGKPAEKQEYQKSSNLQPEAQPAKDSEEQKSQSMRKSKSEYLNKKKKGSPDSQE